MEDRYQNKHRIASARWQQWNYGWDAAYFITICTKDRRHHFGDITDGKMDLSPAGVMADVFWHEIANHASNVGLGAFVVMPNHIHGILILDGNGAHVAGNADQSGNNDNDDINVETRHALSLQNQPNQPNPSNQSNQSSPGQNRGKNTISSIVGGYKSAVTKHANRLGLETG